MIYFALAVFFNVSLFAIFKLFDIFKINTLQAIVTNYFVCILTGLVYLGDLSILKTISLATTWVQVALGLGIFFIVIFYLMAITSQRVSISASTMAAKMSLIVPVAVTLWIFPSDDIHFDTLNYIGLFLVFVAIPLSSYNPNAVTRKDALSPTKAIMLTISIFVGGGLIDAIINWNNAQIDRLPNSEQLQTIFPILTFAVAFVLGLLLVFVQKGNQPAYKPKTFIGGLALGLVNYFSVFLVLKTLSAFGGNAAFVFPNLNMTIIILSSLSAVIFFRERLHWINCMGLLIAIACILLISYQSIF